MLDDGPTRPWTRTFPDDAISLHVVVDGDCLIDTDLPLWRFRLHSGEVLVVAGGATRALRAMTEARPPEVVSARVHLDAPLGHPMLEAFPPLIRASPGRLPRSFGPFVDALREELAVRKIGRAAVVARLCETLFVQALRSHIEDLSSNELSWFRMLADPILRDQLSEASKPTTTVAGFAAAVGRSRQRTRARFTQLSGTRPSAFLRRERVRRAAGLLAAGETDLDRIAKASGYATRQGLCRAFLREFGVTPAAHWRAIHRRPFPKPTGVPAAEQPRGPARTGPGA
jgi:AraC-like DNA-binding protein